jgi:hypothetical protein
MKERFRVSERINRCDRCGSWDVPHTIMSMFNTDVLCGPCKDAETKHPDYEKAREAEGKAVLAGDVNFPGIGWPGENRRVKPLVTDKRARIFHLTENGKTSLCGIITHAALIHISHAGRELDQGEWCEVCQEERRNR